MTTQTRTLKQLAQDVTITATRREPTAQETTQWVQDMAELDKHSGRTHTDRVNATRYFTVTLGYRGRRMTTLFHQGSAWTTDPTAEDVLDCLVSDASGYDNARSFEEWASEYGYDTDSRRAERTYRQVQALTARLKLLLGSEYRAFVEAERD